MTKIRKGELQCVVATQHLSSISIEQRGHVWRELLSNERVGTVATQSSLLGNQQVSFVLFIDAFISNRDRDFE